MLDGQIVNAGFGHVVLRIHNLSPKSQDKNVKTPYLNIHERVVITVVEVKSKHYHFRMKKSIIIILLIFYSQTSLHFQVLPKNSEVDTVFYLK